MNKQQLLKKFDEEIDKSIYYFNQIKGIKKPERIIINTKIETLEQSKKIARRVFGGKDE